MYAFVSFKRYIHSNWKCTQCYGYIYVALDLVERVKRAHPRSVWAYEITQSSVSCREIAESTIKDIR